MKELQIFNDSRFGDIRVSIDNNGEPLFCLLDLCKSLNISNTGNVRVRLDEDDIRLMDDVDSAGKRQNMTFVTEPGMYDVILKSSSPLAKPMQKWVTSKVLPAIRKHGAFATESVIEKAISDPDFIIRIFTELKNERIAKQQLEEDNQIQQLQLEAQAGKVLFADAVEISSNSVNVAEVAKMISQKGVEMGQQRLFKWLRDNEYLVKNGKNNQPTQKSMELKLFEIKLITIIKPDGTSFMKSTPKVTGKGVFYFISKFSPPTLRLV